VLICSPHGFNLLALRVGVPAYYVFIVAVTAYAKNRADCTGTAYTLTRISHKDFLGQWFSHLNRYSHFLSSFYVSWFELLMLLNLAGHLARFHRTHNS